jgi:hypothetical protein
MGPRPRSGKIVSPPLQHRDECRNLLRPSGRRLSAALDSLRDNPLRPDTVRILIFGTDMRLPLRIDFDVDEPFGFVQHSLEIRAPRLRLCERLAFEVAELGNF